MQKKWNKIVVSLALGVGLAFGSQFMPATFASTNVAEAADYWCYADEYGNQFYVNTSSITGNSQNFYVVVKKVKNGNYNHYADELHYHFFIDTSGTFEFYTPRHINSYVYEDPLAQAIWDVCQNYF